MTSLIVQHPFSTPTQFTTETPRQSRQSCERNGCHNRRNDGYVRTLKNWLTTSKNETKERIDQLEIAFAIAFKEFEHHEQGEISKYKGKDIDVT